MRPTARARRSSPRPNTNPHGHRLHLPPATSLTVAYDTAAGADGPATVTVNGRSFVLEHVRSGSGARYETKDGLAAGATLVWWNKGAGGMLLEGCRDDPAAQEVILGDCAQAAG